MGTFFTNLFSTDGFMARWQCGDWSATHGWLHILSDTAIWGAYTAIPLVIAFFTIRRRDIPFPRIMWLFAAFIVSCGLTHLIDAGIFWWPAYRFSGILKLTTAAVSWATVVALVQVMPVALRLPGLARMNSELKRANKDLDAFASIVSHDLKAPLRAISALATWTEEDSENLSDDSKQHLKDIRDRVLRMDHLIDGILEYSRAGRVGMPVQLVDAHEVADRIIQALEAPDSVSIQIDGRLPTLAANAAMFEQNIQNLLGNAVRHVDKADAIVRISAKDAANEVEFIVADNGEGIAEADFDDVFKLFHTRTAEGTPKGTGIGLAIVKKNAEAMGGRAWVSSRLGEGTEFHFTISKTL